MASMAMSVIISMACHFMGSAEQWRAVGLGPKVSDISNGTHVHASYSFENLHRRKPLIIAMTLYGHSMGFAATLGGDVLAVLELERYHKIRYFDLRVLSGMNENFRNIEHLCEWVMDHRQQSCIERLTSMQPEPDEDDASFEIRAMKQREKVLYENAMERCLLVNSIFSSLIFGVMGWETCLNGGKVNRLCDQWWAEWTNPLLALLALLESTMGCIEEHRITMYVSR